MTKFPTVNPDELIIEYMDNSHSLTQMLTFKKWVAALRSGTYKQGKDLLHRIGKESSPDQFCCLGVLCAISSGLDVYHSDTSVYYHGTECVLPTRLMEQLEFDSNAGDIWILPEHWPMLYLELTPAQYNHVGGPSLDTLVAGGGNKLRSNLACLNDAGASFLAIATIIEDNFISPEFR